MGYAEIARADSPRGEVVLRSREGSGDRHSNGSSPVLELRVNGVFVMDTAEVSTEVELARAALALVDRPRHVVVGGLGLGFTLQAVLADPRVERVSVVEIEGALIAWMREGTIPHGPGVLADRRVRMVNADLALVMAETRERYDLVLLDVDNGPTHLVRAPNASLYEAPFLRRLHGLLDPGGAVAVWSADEAVQLEKTLRAVFDRVEHQPMPVRLGEREEQYHLYLGRG